MNLNGGQPQIPSPVNRIRPKPEPVDEKIAAQQKYFVGESRGRLAATFSRSSGGNRRNAGRALGRGAPRICRLRSSRPFPNSDEFRPQTSDVPIPSMSKIKSKNVAFVLRHSFVIRPSPFVIRHSAFEACPSRQARDFEAVTGLTMQLF
jgi:hypothetical protein